MGKVNKIRVVLVGCGGISNAWLGPMGNFDDIEVVGLVDLNLENARQVQEKHHLETAQMGDSLPAMLERTKPDAVFDCTVPEAHAAVTLEAFKHGCHVLGEKPMADSIANAKQMVAAATASQRVYAVIQNRRYLDSIIRYRDTINSGAIGALTTLNADFYLGPHFGGFREAMQHVLLRDMAIHSFDQARFISGTDPLSVYCHEWNPPGSWYSHGASAVAIFEMSQDVVFTYRGSWCAAGLNTSWECEWRGIGTQGSANWDGKDQVTCQQVTNEPGFIPKCVDVPPATPTPLTHQAHAALIREFVDCIRSGATPQTVCTDNIRSLAMVDAAIESAETGRKIQIEV